MIIEAAEKADDGIGPVVATHPASAKQINELVGRIVSGVMGPLRLDKELMSRTHVLIGLLDGWMTEEGRATTFLAYGGRNAFLRTLSSALAAVEKSD